MDRLYDEISQKAIRLAGTLDDITVHNLSQEKISPSDFSLLAAKMKAADLEIGNCFVLESVLRAVRERNYAILRDRFPAIQATWNYFIFPNISSAQDSIDDIYLTKKCLEGGAKKNHDKWWQFSLENNKNIVVPNSRIIYQIMRRSYELRDNPGSKKITKACVKRLQNDFDKTLHMGTKIRYGPGLEATIEHLQLDKSVQNITLDVPEFTKYDNNWSYLVLAKEQPESGLGNVEAIPDNAKPFLEALLGESYKEAGAVCQYIASRKNNLLREARLWVPTASYRHMVRALVLGVDDNDRFGIYASGNILNYRPARGVVSRKNFP